MQIAGTHFDSNTQIARFVNDTDPTLYQQNGGNLTEPNGIAFNGVWANAIAMTSSPSTAVIQVQDGGDRTVLFSGSLGLTEDVPNNRWDIGNAGLKMQGNLSAASLIYSANLTDNVADASDQPRVTQAPCFILAHTLLGVGPSFLKVRLCISLRHPPRGAFVGWMSDRWWRLRALFRAVQNRGSHGAGTSAAD